MAPITLEKVTKVYPNGFEAVHELDLDVADGEFMVLVGPSGCGKTTALRMVAGLEDITDGDAPHRRPDRQRPAAKGPRHRHGLPELRAVPAHDRGREHRLRAEGCARCPRPRSSSRVEEAAEMLGLDESLDRKPGQLSGGQRQRVAMGRAIVREPQRVPDGRAALEPRRQAPRPDARRDRAHPRRARRDDALRHPRPGRGDDDGRPGRGAARRRAAAVRHARRRSTTTRRTSSSPASSARRR